jgi:hypothetical protein
MKKISFFFFLIASTLQAQNDICGFEQFTSGVLKNAPFVSLPSMKTEERATVYTIPVVFHIIHSGGDELISDAQVQSAIDLLNLDFSFSNADTSAIETIFRPIAADAQIRFELARLDPNGNCTNGIEHIYSTSANVATDCAKLNQWDPTKYMNIWVVGSIAYTPPSALILGYSYPPAMAAMPEYSSFDGIMISHTCIGNIGTALPGRHRTLTHEAGHYLNLLHPYGSCTDADGIADTPPSDYDMTGSCLPDSSCNPAVRENWQNFMAGTNCVNMFTAGQVAVMHATLMSPVAGRNNLCSAANLASTGVGGAATPCPPNAIYGFSHRMGCVSDSIQLFDFSDNGTVTSWNWSISNGATSLTSTDQNPILAFPDTGYYSVTLTVSNSYGSSTISRSDEFFIHDGVADLLAPATYDFDDSAYFYHQAPVFNPDNNSSRWRQTDTTSYAGGGCAMINSFGACAGEKDELVFPCYNISGSLGTTFTFYYAGASADTAEAGLVRIFSSYDCGQTWQLRKYLTSAAVNTAGPVSGYFVPLAGHWVPCDVALPSYLGNILMKIQYESGASPNNFYIDNAQMHFPSGLSSQTNTNSVSVYPNPATDKVFIKSEQSITRVEIFDLLGKLLHSANLSEEESIDLGQFETGLYLIRTSTREGSQLEKLIISR